MENKFSFTHREKYFVIFNFAFTEFGRRALLTVFNLATVALIE